MAERPGDLPGGTAPKRRLPITPETWDLAAVRSRAWRVRRPRAFPLSAPTWPGGVPRPPVARTLGMDYDTKWARRYPARLGRVLVSELIARPAVHALTSPEVSGLDRLAHLDEPVIFAANHASHFDTPLFLSVVPEKWRHHMFVAGAADYFFDTRVKAITFAFLLNAVPIERQRVSRDSANRVAALLAEGWSLLIFPEGGRSPDGWGQPHRAGAAWLGVRTGRPVVPVHIEGTRRILAKGASRLTPGPTHVTFGRPLRPQVGGDPRALAADLEQAVAALADEQTTDWWTARKRAAARTSPSLTGPQAGAWRRTWALGDGASSRRRGASTTTGWPRD
ncbi:MAG TPA: lysophospholipid acyltransferase family protein [Acidimicrobiales bacterium]